MKILEDLEAFFEVTKRSGVELVFRLSVIWDVDLVVREREREIEDGHFPGMLEFDGNGLKEGGGR